MVRKFLDDRCTTHAAALSFSSLLSIVPFLAIVFSILKALDVQSALAPIILSNVAAGSQEIILNILGYISNTKVGSLGAIGLVSLFFTIITTIDYLEDAFNQIWGIEKGKSYHRRIRDYLIVIFTIPLLIALATSITSSLQNQMVIRWLFQLPGFSGLLLLFFRLIPYVIIWSVLVCLYLLIPNIRIRLKNALIGGLLAGFSWQVAQWCYIHFQIGVSKSNAIYGTLALLPVFMAWIYTSWIIVLAGMEIVHYLQEGPTQDGPP